MNRNKHYTVCIKLWSGYYIACFVFVIQYLTTGEKILSLTEDKQHDKTSQETYFL
jgi:hypothetical protein